MSIINYDIDDVQYIDVDFHNITQTSTAYAKQYDTKSRYIVATVWKDGMPYTIPSGWDVTFRATKPDGKGILNPCIIEDGKIVYQITTQTTTVDGMFDCEFSVSTGEGKNLKTISCPKFRMRVEAAALTDETIISTDEVTVLVDLIKDTQDLIKEGGTLTNDMKGLITKGNTLYGKLETSESARVAAENTRATKEADRQTKETARVSAETGRASAETNRVNAENARAAKESTRVTAETDRVNKETARVSAESGRANAESKRVTAENTRNTKEAERQSAESTRVSNEATRVSKETARVAAESDRATAESKRATAETDRVDKETARVKAETSRDGAETARKSQEATRQSQESTRVSQENTRVSQEKTRQDYYNAYKVCEAYSSTKAYVVGNKVTYQGSTYQNIVASTGVVPTNTTNWILIAAKGVDGAGGDMFKSYYDPQDKKQDIFAYADKIGDRLDNQIGTASGSLINLPNSFQGGLLLNELQGKSIQNGTPAPDAKVDIVSVGDNGSVVVRVTGKNLWKPILNNEVYTQKLDGSVILNPSLPASGKVVFKEVLPQGIYTIDIGTFTTTIDFNFTCYINGVNTSIYSMNLRNSRSRTINLEASTLVEYRIYNIIDERTSFTIRPQLIVGDKIGVLEPYKEQLVTIPLTQPLRSVGSVCDRIIKKDGVWGVERKFASVVFDGSSDEGWTVETTNTSGIYRIKSDKLMSVIKKVDYELVSNLMSNRYKTVSGGDTYSKTPGISSVSTGRIVVYDSNFITGDASLYKTWLSKNPLSVIYELETPVFEPFTQAIQDKLNSLQSYQGVTNVFTTDPLQPNMIVEYGKTDTSALSLYASNVPDNKLDKTSVANNLITTVEGTVLDGRQGKALSDKIGNLSDLETTSKTDLVGAVNEVKTKIDDASANVKNQIGVAKGSNVNLPSTFNGGLLLKELQGKSVQNGVPSPDAKADIASVGDDGSVVVRVTGKNLLKNEAKPYTHNGITYTVNSDGSITANGTSTAESYIFIRNKTYNVRKGTYTLSGKSKNIFTRILKSTGENVVSIGTQSGTFTVNEDLYNCYVQALILQGKTVTNEVIYPQLEMGVVATTYEPYKEQLITIPLTQPLRSVGSVYDRVIKKDGLRGIERNLASVVFDGSADEDWKQYTTDTDGKWRYAIVLSGGKIADLLTNNALCSHFKLLSHGQTHSLNQGFTINIDPGTNLVSLYVYLDGRTVDNFKTWLKANPISVVYELAIPVFEPFSQSIQDSLNKLQTYQGVTNVFTTDKQQPNMIVEYGTTDTSALSIYANNISDTKANKVDIPTSLPANGGNADTLGGLSSSDYMKATYKTLYNGASLFSYVLNDMKDSTSEVVRIYDGTDVPIEYGYVPKANDFIFHIDKIDHGYSIIRAHDNRSNREFMIRSGNNIWSKWKEIGYGGMIYLRATNVDLFAYIDSLTDEDFPPNSTVTIRAFNCKNSPLDGFPVKVEYSLSNGGDFIVEASRLEHKDWYVLSAREMHTNKMFTCGKRGGVWKSWSSLGDICILPDGTDIEKDFLNNHANDYHWTVRTFRIGNSPSAPTSLGYNPNNNDFYYTVYKMGHDWMKLEARDVRSNRQFVNSKLGGTWTGWIENVQTDTLGHLYVRREQGGRQEYEGGQINLEKPVKTGLSGDIVMDIVGNYFRLFEEGGVNRGVQLDITTCSSRLRDRILTSKNVTVSIMPPELPNENDLWIW